MFTNFLRINCHCCHFALPPTWRTGLEPRVQTKEMDGLSHSSMHQPAMKVWTLFNKFFVITFWYVQDVSTGFCLWEHFIMIKKRSLNSVMYRNRVEICSMLALLFIFSSLTAAVHRLGGGVFPHAHPCVFNVVVVFLLLCLCPSSVFSLWSEHCRWILQSDYIIQDWLIYLEK